MVRAHDSITRREKRKYGPVTEISLACAFSLCILVYSYMAVGSGCPATQRLQCEGHSETELFFYVLRVAMLHIDGVI